MYYRNKVYKIVTIFIFLVANNAWALSTTEYFHAKSALEVAKYVESCPAGTQVFIDIDDTIITPASKSFKSAPHGNLIDDIKKNKSAYKNYEEILSNWRLQRKVMLVDHRWPTVVAQLKQKFNVFALTKMDIGQFGNIPSMEQWRYKELKRIDIEFTDIESLAANSGKNNSPTFFHGIFLTGSASKGQTLEKYRAQFTFNTIVLVDDRMDNLEDVEAFCQKYDINFKGILFLGMENLNEKSDPELAKFQKDYLIKNAQWLEDEDASIKMRGYK